MTPFKDNFDLTGLSKIDYSPLGLDENPFPSVGVPDDIPTLTADRKDVLEHFKTSLRETIFEGKSSITVLTGDWGAGKSHLLKYFKHKVNSQLLDSETPVLAIYLKSVGRNFKDLYLYFIDDVGRDFLTNISKQFVKNYLNEIGNDKMKEYIHDKEIKNSTDLNSLVIDDFLLNSRYHDLFHDIRKSVSDLNNNTLNALLYLTHPNYFSIAWRWFLGEKLNSDERNSIKIQDNIEDSKTAEIVLGNLVNFLVKTGFDSVVLLVDEFENFSLIPKNQRDRYMNELRHFIDENPNKLYIVVAGTPTAYADMTEVPSALTRRLAGQEFILDTFEINDIKELLRLYLENARIDDTTKISQIVQNAQNPKLYPFTDEAVEALFDRTKGNVGYVLKICKKAILEIVRNGKNSVDKDMILSLKI